MPHISAKPAFSTFHTSQKWRTGFTLVELAIVITIIGLLIGGVLKGQELLENARITAVGNQVKAYQAAVTTFRDVYKSTPGDSLNATNFIQGCTAGNNCVNGNGNGQIEGTTTYTLYWYAGFGTAECFQAWKHMALAGLITGVDTTVALPATFQAGRDVPATPVGGLYYIKTVLGTNSAISTALNGTVLYLSAGTNGNNTISSLTLVTPSTAMKMDLKLDDGIASTGDMRSASMSWNTGCGDSSNGANGYNPNVGGKACDVGFLIAN